MAYQAKYFTDKELACKHCGVDGCTDELKQALDALREILGQPVIVHDAYRCPEHNAAISLVAKSQHPEGTAADISVEGLDLQTMYDAAKTIKAFAFGGIGVYDGNFIHVDVRTNGPARWAFVNNKEVPASALVDE